MNDTTTMPQPGEVQQAPKVPWYRRPWAFAMYGVLGAAVLFSAFGGGESDSTATTASQEQAAQEQAAQDLAAQEQAAQEQAAQEQAAQEQAAEEAPIAPTDEKDNLTFTSEVAGAQDDLGDLRGDIADLKGDLASGSIGWASWNMAEITVNVADLSTFTAPPSIAGAWAPLMADLDAANDALMAGFEADSVGQMEGSLDSMLATIEAMEAVLGSW